MTTGYYKKTIFSVAILGRLASSAFFTSWHYDTDGCDTSECLDKAREIKKK